MSVWIIEYRYRHEIVRDNVPEDVLHEWRPTDMRTTKAAADRWVEKQHRTYNTYEYRVREYIPAVIEAAL